MSEDLRPLARWDDDESSHADLVWWSRLDGRWQVEVQRRAPYLGELVIFDHLSADAFVHGESVPIAYDAPFGPDAADVAVWQERAVDIVDGAVAPRSAGEDQAARVERVRQAAAGLLRADVIEAWLDRPTPVFSGRTPREMCATEAGTRQLIAALVIPRISEGGI